MRDSASLGEDFTIRGLGLGEGPLRAFEGRLERGFFRLSDFLMARQGACHRFEAHGRAPVAGPDAALPLPVEDPFEQDATPCVAGLVWRNGEWQFAYWVGTSFATPMVSGLAALAAETKPPNRTVAQIISAGLTAVDPGESLGGGIINVDQSMAN